MLTIPLRKVCYIIQRAHEFDAEMAPDDPDAEATEDQDLAILEARRSNPTYDELVAAIQDLNVDERTELIALCWLGRGDFTADEWAEALAEAAGRNRDHTARYLTGMPLLGDHLEEGLDMLGLWPLPERTPLKATVTGTLEHEGVVIEKLHYQSRPGLYVTANLYRPKKPGGRLPAILYVCGHSGRGRDGNKTAFQDHGLWFARNGRFDVSRFPAVQAWLERMRAFGHGQREELDAQEAIALARAATPVPLTPPSSDTPDPSGLALTEAQQRRAAEAVKQLVCAR